MCLKDKWPSFICGTCVLLGKVPRAHTVWQHYGDHEVIRSFLFPGVLFSSGPATRQGEGWQEITASGGTLTSWGKEPRTRLPAFWRHISKWRQKALCTVSPGQGWAFQSVETFVLLTALVTTFHLLLYLNLKLSTIFTCPFSYKYWTLYFGFFAENPLLTDHYLSMVNCLQMSSMWLWKINQCGHSFQNPKCQCWWCTQSWVYHWRGHISNAVGTTLL